MTDGGWTQEMEACVRSTVGLLCELGMQMMKVPDQAVYGVDVMLGIAMSWRGEVTERDLWRELVEQYQVGMEWQE